MVEELMEVLLALDSTPPWCGVSLEDGSPRSQCGTLILGSEGTEQTSLSKSCVCLF